MSAEDTAVEVEDAPVNHDVPGGPGTLSTGKPNMCISDTLHNNQAREMNKASIIMVSKVGRISVLVVSFMSIGVDAQR